jgi:hypothetical protein
MKNFQKILMKQHFIVLIKVIDQIKTHYLFEPLH